MVSLRRFLREPLDDYLAAVENVFTDMTIVRAIVALSSLMMIAREESKGSVFNLRACPESRLGVLNGRRRSDSPLILARYDGGSDGLDGGHPRGLCA